ncbi:MAG: phosphonate utilization associated transcriptional regulator [Sporomusa sp.]|jgi:DNA-binding GntR family transcriptional regulator|nr:phosphonate utilization associated transcriptional regulator [Sporomusa sp.]
MGQGFESLCPLRKKKKAFGPFLLLPDSGESKHNAVSSSICKGKDKAYFRIYNVFIRDKLYERVEKIYSKSMKSYNLKNQIKTSYRTLPGMITNILREAILSGELTGGVQLKQEELATKFNVSMSALREALKSLEAEGLVRFYPNRGAVVSELSVEEAQEIFDIRLFLELGALELAIPNLTDADLLEADEILKKTDDETQRGRWGELNWQFHETLYRPANRPTLLTLIRNMHNNVERYMRLYLSEMNYQTKSQEEHRALLNACTQKNIKAAQKLLRKHMADASISLAGYLSR